MFFDCFVCYDPSNDVQDQGGTILYMKFGVYHRGSVEHDMMLIYICNTNLDL